MDQANAVAMISCAAGLVGIYVILRLDPKGSARNRLLYWLGPPVICFLIGVIAQWSLIVSLEFGAWAAMVAGLLYIGYADVRSSPD